MLNPQQPLVESWVSLHLVCTSLLATSQSGMAL